MGKIKINGHVLPVPEGCKPFQRIADGWCFCIPGVAESIGNGTSEKMLFLAACVAAEWFEHKANTQGLRFGHLMNNGHGDYEIYQECKKAAKAWRRLIDWGGTERAVK